MRKLKNFKRWLDNIAIKLRPFSAVFIIFATTALYIQIQWVYHNQETYGLGCAMWTVIKDNLIVFISALIITFLYIYGECRHQKKESKERKEMIDTNKQIINELKKLTREIKKDKK